MNLKNLRNKVKKADELKKKLVILSSLSISDGTRYNLVVQGVHHPSVQEFPLHATGRGSGK